jgi:hypothetical protein
MAAHTASPAKPAPAPYLQGFTPFVHGLRTSYPQLSSHFSGLH